MCVCDLGGVYIKPARPWVVVHLPSSLATIKRRRPASCRPVVVVSSAVLSCPAVLPSSAVVSPGCLPVVSCRLSAVVVCRLSSVLSSRSRFDSRLRFALPCFPIHPRQIHLYCASLLVVPVVSILSFLAPILQTLCTFCRENNFNFIVYFQCPLSWKCILAQWCENK